MQFLIQTCIFIFVGIADLTHADTIFDSVLIPESDLHVVTNGLDQSSSQNADVDLFGDESFDPTSLSADSETNLFTDNSDLTFSTDFDDQLIDSTLSSSLTDDPFCVGNDVDTPQSFGKKRGTNVCESPKKGSANQGQGSNKKPERDPFSLQQFLDDKIQIGQFFQDLEELCPAKIFLTSIIPICANNWLSRITPQPPYMYSTVWNIVPVRPGDTTCTPNKNMWCCAEIEKTRLPYDARVSMTGDMVQRLVEADLYDMALTALLTNFVMEGRVCYPQSLIDNGVPILDNPNL